MNPSTYRKKYLGLRYQLRLVREGAETYTPFKVTKSDDIAKLVAHLADRDREVVVALSFDNAHQVIGIDEVAVGTTNRACLEPRDLFKLAIKKNASAIALAHAHLSGNPEPSQEDLSLTKKIKSAADLLGIKLLDHVIVSKTAHVSLFDRGLL